RNTFTPSKAGIHRSVSEIATEWIPAFAGMTPRIGRLDFDESGVRVGEEDLAGDAPFVAGLEHDEEIGIARAVPVLGLEAHRRRRAGDVDRDDARREPGRRAALLDALAELGEAAVDRLAAGAALDPGGLEEGLAHEGGAAGLGAVDVVLHR